MPIVFEEVTGSIAPPPTSGSQTGTPAARQPETAASREDELRQQLALLAERAARLHVD